MALQERINFSGIEYIAFAILYSWGLICLAINTFLWAFRYTIEKMGIAPASWYGKDAKPPGGGVTQPKTA